MGAPPPPPQDPGGYAWGSPGQDPSTPAPEAHRTPAEPADPVPGPGTTPGVPPTNGMAVGALVCGILALACGLFGLFIVTLPLAFLLGIAAVVLGMVGLNRAKRTAVGRGQAIAGLVTGGLGLLALVAWVVLLVAGWTAMVSEFGNPLEDPEGIEEWLEEVEGAE